MNHPISRQATSAEIRAYLRDMGYVVRISRDGHVTFKDSQGNTPAWMEGRWVNEYRFYRDIGVVQP